MRRHNRTPRGGQNGQPGYTHKKHPEFAFNAMGVPSMLRKITHYSPEANHMEDTELESLHL